MSSAGGHSIVVEVPALATYVGVLRTSAAAVATRLGFTMDELDDLRMAVDEAAALLLPSVADHETLRCQFDVGVDSVHCAVSARTGSAAIELGGFAWLVLNAVANDVMLNQADGVTSITLTSRRGPKEAEVG